MKKALLLLFTAFFLLSQDQLLANTVVRGQVKDSTGNPIANRTVKVFTNDSSQGCIFTHMLTTNANGYYTDTVSCNTKIKNIFIKVENCNGEWIVKNPSVDSTGDVEVNFVICRPVIAPPVKCKALFQYNITETGIKFSSTPSEVAPGDSIISRTWVFGDSTAPLTGNQADPWHEYKKPGTYNVCLTIKTKKGCESNYCKSIVFQPKPDSCLLKINVTTEKIGPKKFRFSSKETKVAVGDSIIKRIWSFGDGTGNEGNEISPAKEYKDTGVYQVCLKVKTKKGCENQYCFAVVVRDTTIRPAVCKAVFTFTYKDSVAFFNSAASTAPPGDSIISRTWMYVKGTDTLKLEGNVVDTFITYKVPGKYTVLLTIKTKNGCTSTFAGEVKVPEPPVPCNNMQLAIKTEKVAPLKFRFSSSQSIAAGDSIIKRKWKFGDGTFFEGNEPNPLKQYNDTGVYTVCLYIKTKNGCEKETCIQLPVKDSVVKPTVCKAQFTFNIHDKIVKFNSAPSNAPAGDSIISRTWIFGDSSLPVTNLVDPSHTYAKAAEYTVYLYIKTKNGCESKYTAQVKLQDSVKPAPGCKLQAQFVVARVSGKKIQFNSMQTIAQPGDSIIQRKWKFGDGSVLEGNNVNPVKEYNVAGTYNACLVVKTKNGCEASVCKTVNVLDSVPEVLHNVKIISLNPNPVTTRMLATISSSNMNTEVEITVIDIYGTIKFSFKKLLAQGNNIVEIITANLPKGPFFLKVVSRNSRDSKPFYKF